MVEEWPLYLNDDCVVVDEANLGQGRLVHLPTGRKLRFNRCEMYILKSLLDQRPVETIAHKLASQFEFDVSLTTNKVSEFVEALVQRSGILKYNPPRRGGSPWREVTTTPTLNRLYLELTNECNLHCLHCYVPARSHSINLLPQSRVLRLVDEAAGLGATNIYLTGGEIFVRDDIWDIISHIDDRRFCIGIISNGTLLSERDIERLARFSVSFFATSLDGATGSTHDTFRGDEGAFRKTVRTIRALREAGISVRVGITVNRLNYKELPRLFALLKGLNVRFGIGGICPAGRGENVQCLNVMSEDLAAASCSAFVTQVGDPLGDEFDSLRDQLVRQMNIRPQKPFAPSCGIGEDMVFIDSSGFAGLCPTMTARESAQFFAGDIYKQSLREIWERGAAFRLARGKVQCRDLLSCPFAMVCSGGCRSDAFLYSGDLQECDKTSYETYRRLSREICYSVAEDEEDMPGASASSPSQ